MDMRLCTADEILPLRHSVLRAGKPFETARFAGDQRTGGRGTMACLKNDEPMVVPLVAAKMPSKSHPLPLLHCLSWVPVSEGNLRQRKPRKAGGPMKRAVRSAPIPTSTALRYGPGN